MPPQCGVISVDERASTVAYDEHRVKLSTQQMLILRILVQRKGVVTYEQFTQTIDPNARLANAPGQVATQISQIRRLLSDAGIPLWILTVQRRGYYLEPEVELASSKGPRHTNR